MTSETTNETMALRDQGGTWYVLTPEVLAMARATAAQQAALDEQVNADTSGFGIHQRDRQLPNLLDAGRGTLPAGSNGPAAQTRASSSKVDCPRVEPRRTSSRGDP
jgi:hypothetical protein